MAKVKKVSSEIVHPLRHKVLRASLPFESSIMNLDDHDHTFHFCVKEEFRIISVASVYHESFVELPKKMHIVCGVWRQNHLNKAKDMVRWF